MEGSVFRRVVAQARGPPGKRCRSGSIGFTERRPSDPRGTQDAVADDMPEGRSGWGLRDRNARRALRAPLPGPGQVSVLGLVEIMKCFNQITYGGAGLPDRGQVAEILAEDTAEVQFGQVLFRIKPTA